MKALFRGYTVMAAVLVFGVDCKAAAAPQSLDSYLREGKIQAGLAAYATPNNDEQRFALAVLQTLNGLQQFSGGMYDLGIRSDATQNLPFFRVALPARDPDKAKPATREQVAQVFNDFRSSLRLANKTLSGMGTNEFGVEVNLAKVRLDLDGDGVCGPDETLMKALGRVTGFGQGANERGDLVVRFNSADGVWLQGYTHFLSGFLDLVLAYDWSAVWNQCAHVIFYKPVPMPVISRFTTGERSGQWADLIAAVHDMRLPLVNPDGVRRARDEFKSMIASSRICWQRVLAETDNDQEWLPSPKQTGPAGTKITQAQVEGWMSVLDELEKIADGKQLLPHWRFKPGIGINVEKLVASPPHLDLVLLIQGSALVPYCDEGPVSDAARWRQLAQPFGPGFMRFALWSN